MVHDRRPEQNRDVGMVYEHAQAFTFPSLLLQKGDAELRKTFKKDLED